MNCKLFKLIMVSMTLRCCATLCKTCLIFFVFFVNVCLWLGVLVSEGSFSMFNVQRVDYRITNFVAFEFKYRG